MSIAYRIVVLLALLFVFVGAVSEPRASEPHALPDLVDTAVAAGSFETLAAALQTADLVDTLRSDGPFTVLAPTDEAFAKLPPEILQALLQPAYRDTLVSILTYHVVPGRVPGATALAAGEADSVQSASVRFELRDGRLRVNDALVVANDVEASNGLIHVIDSVLLPPGVALPDPNARKVIGVYTEPLEAALASQLQLDRKSALLISRLVKGGNAEADGLERYDIVTRIDGEPATEGSLARAKKARAIGEALDLTVLRGGQQLHVAVRVGPDTH